MKWRDLAGCLNPPGFYQWDQQFVRSVMMSHSEIPLLFVNTSRSAGQPALAVDAIQPSSADSQGPAWKGFAWTPLNAHVHTAAHPLALACGHHRTLWRANRSFMLRAHAQGCVHKHTSRLSACVCIHHCVSTLCTHLQKPACAHPDTYTGVQKRACTHLCMYINIRA